MTNATADNITFGTLTADASGILTVEQFRKYHSRILVAALQFAELGFGSKSQCAFATNIAKQRISAILSARYYDPNALDTIEKWLVRMVEAQTKKTA